MPDLKPNLINPAGRPVCGAPLTGRFRDECQRVATIQRSDRWYCWIHDPERRKAAAKARREAPRGTGRALGFPQDDHRLRIPGRDGLQPNARQLVSLAEQGCYPIRTRRFPTPARMVPFVAELWATELRTPEEIAGSTPGPARPA